MGPVAPTFLLDLRLDPIDLTLLLRDRLLSLFVGVLDFLSLLVVIDLRGIFSPFEESSHGL